MDTQRDEASVDVPDTTPKSDIEVLNQLIDDEVGACRIRARDRVHYLFICTAAFDENTMCRPYLLIPKLPDLPATDWTTMHISRKENGVLESTMSFDTLLASQEIWHPRRIDVLSLQRTKMYRSAVHEVLYQGRPAISKIACFGWDIPRISNEMRAYSIISYHQQQHPDDPRIAPAFLAHLTENGRVIGMLLEKVDGDSASLKNLPRCKEALYKLHDIGLVHGDVNRFNFIVNRAKSNIRLVDFEYAEDFDKKKAYQEIESLPSELAEETGRGGSIVISL